MIAVRPGSISEFLLVRLYIIARMTNVDIDGSTNVDIDGSRTRNKVKAMALSVVVKHAGKTYPVEVDETATAFRFKESIYQSTGVPPGMSYGNLTVPSLTRRSL